VDQNISIHAGFLRELSGQLLFLGLRVKWGLTQNGFAWALSTTQQEF
jgi:hypothetical protein